MNRRERLLALRAFENLVSDNLEPAKVEERELYEPGDRKTVWREVDGRKVKLGAMGLSEPKTYRKVTDKRAYEAWVTEHFPTVPQVRVVEVVEIPEAWTKQVLKDGHVVHPETGEVMEPAGVSETSATPSFRIDPEPDTLHILAAELPELLQLETGKDETDE